VTLVPPGAPTAFRAPPRALDRPKAAHLQQGDLAGSCGSGPLPARRSRAERQSRAAPGRSWHAGVV